jgi:hypothetical protein
LVLWKEGTMLRQRLQAKAIRERMLREHLARPPEPSKQPRQPEQPPEDLERLPADR